MFKLKTTLILVILTAVTSVLMTREVMQSNQMKMNALTASPIPDTGVSDSLVSAIDSVHIERAIQLIQTVSHGQVNVLSHFNAGGNLIGFVIQEQGKNEPAGVLYTDSTGTLLISANYIVNREGKNILERDFAHYVQPEQAMRAYEVIHKTAFLEQGKSDAPHKMYIMLDPNCPHCHTAYMNLQDLIKAGELAVRWIIIGNITPTSQSKALAILGADDPLAALHENEVNFDVKGHSGGIADAAHPSLLATSRLKVNSDFVITNRLAYAPTFFFKTQSGVLKLIPGGLNGEKLTQAVQSASHEF